MNSVIEYWKGRLEEVCPFANRKFLDDEAYSKFDSLRKTTWPDHVSQRALYEDYCDWFSAAIATQITVGELLAHEIPCTVHSRQFNAQIRPFINVGNWDRTWNRRVTVPRNYQGSWFDEQKFQRFYRLSPWIAHAEAYSRMTGGVIDLSNAKRLGLTNDLKCETVP